MSRRRSRSAARRVLFGWLLAAAAAPLSAAAFSPSATTRGSLLAPAPQEGREPGSRPAAEIPWRRDLAAARAEARATGKPLCVVFRCEA